MSADSHKVRELLDESLSDLDDKLGVTGNDLQLLNQIEQRIGRMLRADSSVESEIRAVLQERYNDGELRTETYELVRTMLDQHLTEEVRTEPTGDSLAGGRDPVGELDLATAQLATGTVTDDEYAATAVIHEEVLRPATAEEQVQVGSVLRDRFLLQERVSGGSMGVVYKALDRRLAETGVAEPWVAIKVLSPQLSRNGTALRALQQEAAKGRCLSHANIVRFVDLDREDDLYFIIMEWLEGRTLAEILDSSDTAMGTDQALGIVRQLANALGYAHRCGIVHADVKPANVMILPNGDTKLFDFGVARVRQMQEMSRADFDPGVLGALTPAYSSMQVLTGEDPVPADDVFSLGCLLYRLVAGYRVFGPRNAAEAAEEGMKPQRPQGLTDGQWRALKKAIAFSRVTRFQTMPEFIDALEDHSVANIEIGPTDDFDVEEIGGSRSWFFGLVALLLLLSFAIYEFGFSDPFGWTREAGAWIDAQLARIEEDVQPDEGLPAPDVDDGITDLPAEAEEPIAAADAGATGTADSVPADTAEAPDAPAAGPGEAAVTDASPDGSSAAGEPDAPDTADGTSLPPADVEIMLNNSASAPTPVTVTLLEDSGPTVVDFRRAGSMDLPLELRLEEVGFTGNRSPWASTQYAISNDGSIELAAGQERARMTLEMASDSRREADQVSTLQVRSRDSAAMQYAILNVELEDDDQRAFESRLPVNTIGFAVSQAAVRESDPVVQIDVLRFNPDETQTVVAYSVADIAAKEGEDYFAPGGYSVSFGPGQRSARLLIPLVQDSVKEGDEAFSVELATGDAEVVPDVFDRIAIMIRDDD